MFAMSLFEMTDIALRCLCICRSLYTGARVDTLCIMVLGWKIYDSNCNTGLEFIARRTNKIMNGDETFGTMLLSLGLSCNARDRARTLLS